MSFTPKMMPKMKRSMINSYIKAIAHSSPTYLNWPGTGTSSAQTWAVTVPYGSNLYWTTTGTATGTAPTQVIVYPPDSDDDYPADYGPIKIRDGQEARIELPDGSVIEVADDGSYVINDRDAKVTYRANRVLDFNSFINASDKLETFIKFCGEIGVRQGEMLDLQIRHFIAWLVVEAAKADGESAEHQQLQKTLTDQTRVKPYRSRGNKRKRRRQ